MATKEPSGKRNRVVERKLRRRETYAVLQLILAVLCKVPLESSLGHSAMLHSRQTKSHTEIWL